VISLIACSSALADCGGFLKWPSDWATGMSAFLFELSVSIGGSTYS